MVLKTVTVMPLGPGCVVIPLSTPLTTEGFEEGEGLLKVVSGVEVGDASCLMVVVTVVVLVIEIVRVPSGEFEEDMDDSPSAVDVTTTVDVTKLTQISSRRRN